MTAKPEARACQPLPSGAQSKTQDGHAVRDMEPITVRIPAAIRLTGIGRSKLYELIAAGEIETIKVGRMTLVPVDGLRRFVRRRADQSEGI